MTTQTNIESTWREPKDVPDKSAIIKNLFSVETDIQECAINTFSIMADTGHEAALQVGVQGHDF